MPNQEKCTRCGALLVVPPDFDRTVICPPRAGVFSFLRPALFFANKIMDRISTRILPYFDAGLPGPARTAVFLSIIPGLGHLYERRRVAALIALGGWLIGLFIVANCYVGAMGSFLGGLLLSWHISVMFDAGRVQQYLPKTIDRVKVMAILLLIVGILYYAISNYMHSRYDFVSMPVDSVMANVHAGDILLVPRNRQFSLKAGDLVIGRNDEFHKRIGVDPNRYNDPIVLHIHASETLRYVIAVEGDKVIVSANGVSVNGKALDKKKLLHGIIFPPETFTIEVGKGEVLAIFPSTTLDPRVKVTGEIWSALYLIARANISSKPVGIYWPLSHRRTFNREKNR